LRWWPQPPIRGRSERALVLAYQVRQKARDTLRGSVGEDELGMLGRLIQPNDPEATTLRASRKSMPLGAHSPELIARLQPAL